MISYHYLRYDYSNNSLFTVFHNFYSLKNLMDLSINENYKKLLGYGLQTKLKIFKRLKYQLNWDDSKARIFIYVLSKYLFFIS